MKYLSICTILVLFSSCIDNNRKDENNAIDLNNLCNNQLSLIVKEKNNWKIPLDSIDNFDDFIYYANIKKRESTHKTDTTNQLAYPDSTLDKDGLVKDFGIYNTNVYPYIHIKGKDISLSQILQNSSGGFSISSKDLLKIDYYSRKQYHTESWKDRIYNFI